MLAERAISAQCGFFQEDVHFHDTARQELLDFIASELPRWRDHPDRLPATAETELTDQICSYLNGAARHSTGWSRLQFIPEAPDEMEKSRKIDLAVKPCGAAIWVEGRRHTQFQTLMPVECKRLPAPKDKSHEEREYVFCQNSSRGGIQRFKRGHHGAAHRLVGMIGYVQEGSFEEWYAKVSGWINDLAALGEGGWSSADGLIPESSATAVGRYASKHARRDGLEDIAIHHLWICLN